MKCLKCFVFCLLLSFSCMTAGGKGKFVRVEGTSLVSPDGSEFFIRGTNLGNWLNPEGYMFCFPKRANSARQINDGLCELVGPEYVRNFWEMFVQNYVTEEDIAYLASTGLNTIRIPFHYKMFTDEQYMCFNTREDGYRLMDNVVGWCKKYGIKVILDMHVCPSGQTGDNIDDSYGYPWLFVEEGSRRVFLSIWKDIARHYRNEPAILGYDLMNEPVAHYFKDKEELNKACVELYQEACAEIRKIDKNHILIIGGLQWNGNFKPLRSVEFGDNVMYSCHIYKCPPTVGSISHFVQFRNESGCPMYMGETGENTDEWVHDFRIAMENVGISWTYWCYKKLDNTKGFLNIVLPEGWDEIVRFLEADRSTFAGIREANGDRDRCKGILDTYLENCKFANCNINKGYISALGLKP
ncbi:MAG: cellulase family glycosylhydrolase [Bacteroidales bacterium]|nr:cellulase family glycosylhydrolase [Bacteroidales bacterium]